MRLPHLIRSAFVVGRRDFTATVFSRAFILFLLGPLFPVILGVMFGGIGQRMAKEAERPVVAVVASQAEFDRLAASRGRLARAFDGQTIVKLVRFDRAADTEAHRARLLASQTPPVIAVLEGAFTAPRLTGAVGKSGLTVRQIGLVLDDARIRADAPDVASPAIEVRTTRRSAGSVSAARALTARGGQTLLFLLTILLAGMLLSQLIEEKSNKVIEILAAAIPIDSIFVGKLFAMLTMSLLGIAVWAGAATLAFMWFAPQGLTIPPPAVGWPLFWLFALTYFAMSYLLIGAAFLGIGAQASTVREVQTLSMPVTMAQVVIFAVASAAVGQGDQPAGIAAAVFPLSSPFAMIARAAESPLIWPHLLAILWQAAWVALILRLAARLFRRSVLNSAPRRKRRWWRRAAASTTGSAS